MTMQVIEHSSSRRHAAGRDDNSGTAHAIQRLRFVNRNVQRQITASEKSSSTGSRRFVRIFVLRKYCIDFDGHRAIEANRYPCDFGLLVLQLSDRKKNILRALDGEGRNNDRAAPLDSFQQLPL